MSSKLFFRKKARSSDSDAPLLEELESSSMVMTSTDSFVEDVFGKRGFGVERFGNPLLPDGGTFRIGARGSFDGIGSVDTPSSGRA